MVTGVFEKFGCMLIIQAIKAVTKPATEAVKYVLHCKRNIKKLEKVMGKLEDRMKIIERDVNEAINRGEVIEEDVSRWQTETNTMKIFVLYLTNQSTVEAKIHCFACSCPNIKWRYLLSKQAEKKTADLKDLTQESYKFNKVSHRRPRPQELENPSNENYVDFDSRKQILKDIVDALKKSDGNVIGIHGLGGVGKTTLAVEVAKKMRDDGTFKQFALATVSKDFNVKEIQGRLADKLNCDQFKPQYGEMERARVLWNFLNVGKYLVILDDIWEEVDLKAIGIPITDGKTGSKVVLTSRNKDLLVERMNVNNHFSIAELLEAEAWVLFKKKLGNSTESMPDIDSRAYEVCKKCKGLPVAINALGAALKGKPHYAWVDAINKLESNMLTNIEGVNQNVSASLRLSYDMLSSDAKSCFLLCCFFPEDTEILVDDLVRQCLVRSLLSQNPRTLEEARNAVRTEVHSLKSTYLLSNGNDDNVIRVHDVIRDVGISIAREEEGVLVDHDAVRWPRNPVNRNPYSTISLRSGKFRGLPNKLTCPELHTLMFCNNKCSNLEIPDLFFSGMKKLTVLNLSGMRMQRLPSSLAKLASLGMLCLEHCQLPDLAVRGDLKIPKNSLEVLSLRGSDIKVLPKEIGQLTSLLLLDLRDCKDLEVIPQGVISKLISLEELYLPDTFNQWEATKDTSIKNVTFEELGRSLSTGQLTTLHIHIPNVMLLPKEGLYFKNLRRFKILVDFDKNFLPERCQGTKVFLHKGSCLRNEFIPLVKKAEVVYLIGIAGLKNLLHDEGVGNGFLDLKYLIVKSCNDLEYLLGEPKSFVQSRPRLHPFANLTEVVIKSCKLEYLFSQTTTRGLVHQLEYLEVSSCENMEEIVRLEGQNSGNELIFSKLKILQLRDLPKLTSFFAEKEKTQKTTGSSSARPPPLFSYKVILPVLEELEVGDLDSIEEIWDKQSPLVNQGTESFGQLRNIEVQGCKKLMNLVPSNILPRLQNLQFLEVGGCPNIEFIVFKNKKGEEGAADDSTLIIPQLRYLWIENMEKLKSFCSSSATSNAQSLFNHQVIFPVLETLHIEKVGNVIEIWDKQSIGLFEAQESFCQLMNLEVKNCNKLMHLFPSKLQLLKNLKKLEVDGCETMEGVVRFEGEVDEDGLRNEQVCFSKLTSLDLKKLHKLVSFCTKMGEAGTTEGNPTIHAQPLFNGKVILPVLERLEVEALDSIEEIWDKQSPSVNQETESFGQLRNIEVKGCKKLMNLVPSNILPRLRNLQYLDVNGCPNVEFIVFKNGKEEEEVADDSTLIIPRLTCLEIRNMEKLKSFYSSSTTSNAQSLFNHQVFFPVLEELKISGVDNIIEIWDKQSITVFEAHETFCQLMNVEVRGCNKLTHLFPSKMHPLLKNLKELEVGGCETMEGVVRFEGEVDEDGLRNEQVCFRELTSLRLDDLPKLVSFCTKMGEAGTAEGNPSIHAQPLFNGKVAFPVLEDIVIKGVPMITGIWVQQPLSKPEKEVESFCKLKSINVWYCDQLEYVLPSYMLPQLHNLLQLEIYFCKELEVIVSNKLKEKEATNNDILVFPQLNTLELISLDKLKCFCTGGTDQLLFSHKVVFPALEDLFIQLTPHITEIWDEKPEKEIDSFSKLATIVVYGCHQLVYILPSHMLPRLQNLQKLKIWDCAELEVIVSKELKEKEGTDNDPIVFSQLKAVKFFGLPKLKGFYTGTELFFSKEVAFPALEKITIEHVPKIKEIWDKQPLSEAEKEAISFCNLRRIDVRHCDQLVYVFPSSLLPQLQNLQKLVITNCKEMEVIISNKLKEKEATNNNIILFAELKIVILQFLPNLKRLCSEAQLGFSNKDAFPVLEINTIVVAKKNPWELRDLKTSCIAPNLMFLVNGTSTKEVAVEESGTSSKDGDSNDHDKEGEDGEEDVKNADDNKGVEGEEKDEDEEEGGGGD